MSLQTLVGATIIAVNRGAKNKVQTPWLNLIELVESITNIQFFVRYQSCVGGGGGERGWQKMKNKKHPFLDRYPLNKQHYNKIVLFVAFMCPKCMA